MHNSEAEAILEFLADVRDNNNREWFHANRPRYEEYLAHLGALAEKLIAAVANVNPDAARLTPADCTYRIYRDTRFSADKTPYKTHAGIFINPPYGKKSLRLGHYIHLEPGNILYCAGTIGLPSKTMTAMRAAIRDNIDEYLSIVGDPAFTRLFKMTGIDLMKTAPKGFDRSWVHIDLVRPRQFCIEAALPQKICSSPRFAEKLIPYIAQGERYNAFHNFTVDETI